MEDLPILHSMHKDTAENSKDIAGSNVTEEEAILIASMKESSVKKRTRNFLGIISFVLILISIGMIIIPDLFLNKLKMQDYKNQEKDKTLNKVLKTDGSYKINLPGENDLEEYKQKNINVVNGISEIKIYNNEDQVLFDNLHPLLNQRFIDGIKKLYSGVYMYGIVKESDQNNFFLILNVTDQGFAEKDLLALERTMHSDFNYIFHLSNDSEINTKEFVNFVSVRLPLRELINSNGQTVMVYGFPAENILLITTNKEAYSTLRTRILSGF